jgi:transcriptional regulator with PAS, ATPase and Fis domain
VGQADEDLFGADYAAQAKNIEIRVLEGQTIESRHSIRWGGQRIDFDVIRFPLRQGSGDITGICGIAREVATPQEILTDSAIPHEEYPSAAMQSTTSRAKLAAQSDSIIMLTGESGSGKDYLARYIHEHSSRSAGPFYSVNCAAIPVQLAESELFGHEAGAFTGAVRRKRGLMELAEGGTVLLNEVGDLPELLQAKLLTFLDTFSFTRVGGEKAVKVNVRLIAATNKDLTKEVHEGRFRKDLFYRLNVFVIEIPPLRDRTEDIPVLANQLLARLTADLQAPTHPKIRPAALDRLSRYVWPGNIRELRNVLERALILSRGKPLTSVHLGLDEGNPVDGFPAETFPLRRALPDVLDDIERPLIQEALRRSKGQKYGASRLLGISRYALARRMSKLGIPER